MDLLTMSFSAAVMIAAIVILRALLIDRLPKTTFLILWAVVLLRLLVPVSVPSVWSVYSLLQPKQQSIQTVQEESTVLPQVEPVVSQPSAITTEPAAPPVKQKKSLQRRPVRKVLPQRCSRAPQLSSRRRQKKKQSLQSPCRWSRRP